MTNSSEGKIPVTVLTGFLGAGKTTLLNRIMTEQHGKRIAIIQNEFGEIGIDGALVINADEEIFEMNNGCICCTVRGDLIRILGNLQKRRHKFDYVLIETDGLADPAPVAQTFFVDPDMQESWKLDGIVTIVDAKHLDLHWDTNDEVKEQIAFADVILLNKTDLVTKQEVARIERKIRSINTIAKLHYTEKSELPIDSVLDIGAFDLERILEVKPEFLEPEVPFEWSGTFELAEGRYVMQLAEGPDPTMDIAIVSTPGLSEEDFFKIREKAVVQFSAVDFASVVNGGTILPDQGLQEILTDGPLSIAMDIEYDGFYTLFTQHHPDEFGLKILNRNKEIEPVFSKLHNAEHEHDSEIGSVSIEFAGDLDQKRLNLWISTLLKEKGTDIFRMKGIVSVKGQPNRFVFHGVHMLFDGIPDQPWGNRPRTNQMVFVGKNLNSAELNEGLRGCLS
jgi:G3E family GTPase